MLKQNWIFLKINSKIISINIEKEIMPYGKYCILV